MTDTPADADVLAARARLTNAMHAMHADQRILISLPLAADLETAWIAYDEALTKPLKAEIDRLRTQEVTARKSQADAYSSPPLAETRERELQIKAAQRPLPRNRPRDLHQ